jgi:ATP-dependent helicase/nuclease subunit B
MEIRFLRGPAGSGKTFRCLSEIRAALRTAPEGPPLIFLAPKQATFQLERQLLADDSLAGYTRLHILSFERLARFVFEQLRRPPPRALDEEGRIMVLRGLLARKRDQLRLFRASARLTGFAQQLSLVLRELQRHQLTPETLDRLAAMIPESEGLPLKLHDFAVLLQNYLDWLQSHRLQDADCRLDAATMALNESSESGQAATPPFVIRHSLISSLWLDGFAELSPQELALLAAVVSRCEQATLAFCLGAEGDDPALSHWSVVRRTFQECKKWMEQVPGAVVSVESLARDVGRNRFQRSPALQHLERHWARPQPFVSVEPVRSAPADQQQFEIRFSDHSGTPAQSKTPAGPDTGAVRLVACANPEAEAILAARELLRFVRAGRRFREAAVLVRNLENYHEPLQRVFARYEIPFFLDRREPVTHHPLAELTRNALRTAAFQWSHDDWFAALKTGLVLAGEIEIDRLENEALARGWKGAAWLQPVQIPGEPELSAQLESLRRQIVPPFQKLTVQFTALQNQPTGPQLAAALRQFWSDLDVDAELDRWSEVPPPDAPAPARDQPAAVHQTVREQMNAWLDNVTLAFHDEALPLREWLPILESGLSNLTVGMIPPALDHVLVGAVDRSRNPELKLAIVLGLNETVFPAAPEDVGILTDSDCEELSRRGVSLPGTLRQRAARERYFGYIACTRAAEKLLLGFSSQNAEGAPLNVSPFIPHLQRLFPALEIEEFHPPADWNAAEHPSELAPLLAAAADSQLESRNVSDLLQLPALARLRADLRRLRHPDPRERLSPEIAAALYGPVLRTSVSRLEEFAACPFRFFVHSGLRAAERKRFELDAREQGTFQHDALKLFHEQLAAEGKRWRDLTPAEARERMGRIATGLTAGFRDGLMDDSAHTRFTAQMLTRSLQDFIAVIVGWMRGQYEFDPVAVELEFGGDTGTARFETDLGDGHKLALQGRIDRVDLWRAAGANDAFGVVVDYKSGLRFLDPTLVHHGVQLQLLAYLNVLRRWANAPLGVSAIRPAGVFYVNLRGLHQGLASRALALDQSEEARRSAYLHTGRFAAEALPLLDRIRAGGQFKYRLNQDGTLRAGSTEALTGAEFERLLDRVEALLVEMGRRIYAGAAEVEPYRRGKQTPCDFCDYRSICRIDPWTHGYRTLEMPE